MLLTVVILSGLLLSASTIGGLLMLYQIRQSADIANSSKAIYAADSGLEWRLYKFFKDGAKCLDCPDGQNCTQPSFSNDAAIFQASCVLQSSTLADGSTEDDLTVKATGEASRNYRALETTFSRVTPPPPPPPAP